MSRQELINTPELFSEIRSLIEESRQKVAIAVNAEISMLYWHIGKRIKEETLQGKRAEYGQQIIASLSKQLTEEYGKGWSKRQLHLCIKFAETFKKKATVYTLCTQLSWSHIRQIIAIDNPLKREFYIEISQMEKWSVRTLQERINSMLFERTAIKPTEFSYIRNESGSHAHLIQEIPLLTTDIGIRRLNGDR